MATPALAQPASADVRPGPARSDCGGRGLAGGPPLADPIVRHGPFVMNTRAELQSAVGGYRAGRFGTIKRRAAVAA